MQAKDRKRLARFVQAVAEGAYLAAGPETAQRLRERGLDVKPSEYVPEGSVFAVRPPEGFPGETLGADDWNPGTPLHFGSPFFERC